MYGPFLFATNLINLFIYINKNIFSKGNIFLNLKLYIFTQLYISYFKLSFFATLKYPPLGYPLMYSFIYFLLNYT